MPRIKDIIIDTFLSVKKKMNPSNRHNCFELFGFDFLLDEDFRIWLIEVNHNPFLGTPNNYMKGLVPRMIDDMLKIVVDPVLKPNTDPDADRPNDFEMIFREASKKNGPVVNSRRPFSMDLVYPVPELVPFIGKPKTTTKPAHVRLSRAAQLKKAVDQSDTSAAYETNGAGSSNGGGEIGSPRKDLTA